jgi:hypothetical protein
MPTEGLLPLSSGESISSTIDSPRPTVFSVRETSTDSASASSSGATWCSHMRVISAGGPGITTM